MRVQFLGTGGYHPNERRHTACIHLPDSGVVFDAGTAMFRLPAKLEAAEIDVFLSHAHLDHIIGLTYLLPAIDKGLLNKVRLYATEQTLSAVQTHLFAKTTFPVMPDFDFRPLSEHPHVPLANGAVLTHHPLVSHQEGSTAYRIDWEATGQTPPKAMAYVTDTSVDGTYADFVHGVDLLIHECYFPDTVAGRATKFGHSHTTPVAELARDAEVGQLVLVHIDPQCETDDPIGIEVARAIHVNTEIAEDGLEVVL